MIYQLPGGLTFAFDFYIGRSVTHWKGHGVRILVGPGHVCGYQLGGCIAKRHRLGPQNDPRSLGPRNYEKTAKLENNYFEPGGYVGGHRFPPRLVRVFLD